MQRRSRQMCKKLYKRDAIVAVMAWTYGWNKIISAYMSDRDAQSVQPMLTAWTRSGIANQARKHQAIMRVLHLFLPPHSVARKRLPALSRDDHESGRQAMQGTPRPHSGTFDADVDVFAKGGHTTETSADVAKSDEERRRLMLDTDPHALLAAIDRVNEEEKPLVDVLSAPRVPSDLVLDGPDQALLAQNLTAGLLRAFLCYGQRRRDQLYYRGDGKTRDVSSVDARAARWAALEKTFVSVSYDEEVMETFINPQTKCCSFWVIATDCYVLDVRQVNDRVARQKRYEEVHLNSESENEHLLAPGHLYEVIETLEQKQQHVLNLWKREARLHGVSYRVGNQPTDMFKDTGMKYATFGDVAFQMQPYQGSHALGKLFFLGYADVTQYKQDWFRSLDDVVMVRAQFSSRLFRNTLTREPSLLAAVQTWSSVPASRAELVD